MGNSKRWTLTTIGLLVGLAASGCSQGSSSATVSELAQLQTVLFHFPPLGHAIIEQLLEFDQEGSLVPTHTNVQLQSTYTAVIQRHLSRHKEQVGQSGKLGFQDIQIFRHWGVHIE